ncbi:MAG: hypothetical protein D6730_03660 [Bacteroidetes bacterium]|nr:MAG: hypothetical protein D6730_03660 [Bacteroidota bacterium]
MKYLPLLLMLCLCVLACSPRLKDASGDQVTASEENARNARLESQQIPREFALEAYLRRQPGVIVQGSGVNARVQIRGVNSFSGNTEPLFIVNGNDVGQSYARAAELLRGMEIKSVKVLKDSDATLYGIRGAGGVIIITAK